MKATIVFLVAIAVVAVAAGPGLCNYATTGTACYGAPPGNVHWCISGFTYYDKDAVPGQGYTYSWVGASYYVYEEVDTTANVDTSKTIDFTYPGDQGVAVIFKQSGGTIYPEWYGDGVDVVNPQPNQTYNARIQSCDDTVGPTYLNVYYKIKAKYTSESNWLATQTNAL